MAGASKKTEDFTLSKDFDPCDLALICLVKKLRLRFRFWESSLKETHPKHREHTLLLNRKRVTKGMKRTNSLPLSPVVLTRPHATNSRDLTAEKTAIYKYCVAL